MKDYVRFTDRNRKEEPILIKELKDVKAYGVFENGIVFTAACPLECEEGMIQFYDGELNRTQPCPVCENDNRIYLVELEYGDDRLEHEPFKSALIAEIEAKAAA